MELNNGWKSYTLMMLVALERNKHLDGQLHWEPYANSRKESGKQVEHHQSVNESLKWILFYFEYRRRYHCVIEVNRGLSTVDV